MLQSVFLMMEGSDGGIAISGLRLMISVRLPLFDSEPGTRRNRTWDVARPNLGRDATEPGTRRNRTWDVARPNLGRDATESGTAFAGKFG